MALLAKIWAKVNFSGPTPDKNVELTDRQTDRQTDIGHFIENFKICGSKKCQFRTMEHLNRKLTDDNKLFTTKSFQVNLIFNMSIQNDRLSFEYIQYLLLSWQVSYNHTYHFINNF